MKTGHEITLTASMSNNQLARGRDLNRKKARDKQNALVTREQTKKLLDVLDPLIPQGERSLGELRGSLPSQRTVLHLLEDLVVHLRAMPASSRASEKERKARGVARGSDDEDHVEPEGEDRVGRVT